MRLELRRARSCQSAKSGTASEKFLSAHIAQSVERVLGKDEVTGSSPVVGSSSVGD
jgi:hypothetical protein